MRAFPGGGPDWDRLIAGLPGASILQTWEWAQVKRRYGWQPMPLIWEEPGGEAQAAAMALSRSIRLGGFAPRLSVVYVPRGPLLDWQNAPLRVQVLDDMQSLARRGGVIFLKMDPEVVLGTGIPGSPDAKEEPVGEDVTREISARGWRFSSDQVQFRNTVMLDLAGSEEMWLSRMKQKTRYNLRLAQRKGVSVRCGTPADLGMLYQMYAQTAVRDGFVIRPEEYYRAVWSEFMARGMCTPLIAEVEGQAVAGLVLFVFAGRAWYLYGMSRVERREWMPNYLLQWEAMRRARTEGALAYDLWGAPDEFVESDSMWGVFRFKEGLGGMVVRTLGAWDFTARPALYQLYTRILPRLLDVMRRRGKERTRREVA
jgi:lipid II:glycine glycyltransferase (peptidoglycan interpeptide bridge formation enzyme)